MATNTIKFSGINVNKSGIGPNMKRSVNIIVRQTTDLNKWKDSQCFRMGRQI